MKLENKVAIITGATKGIGFEVTKLFLKNGCRVVVCGSRQETADEALDLLKKDFDEKNILALGVNMNSEEDIKKMIEQTLTKFNKIDILVNNAGISMTSDIENTSLEDFNKIININLIGPFLCTKLVVEEMKKYGGSIINTSSMVSRYASTNQVGYVTSKFALNGLTLALARDLGKYNIRVNAIAPGVINTPMVEQHVTEEMKKYLEDLIPLKRMGTPEEIAKTFLYLASDESSYTTGTIIDVNGGLVK